MTEEKMKIEYFFDVISPYAAFSWEVLKRYQTVWDFELKLIPVFLGGIMHGTGNKPPATLPAKGAHMQTDLARNAVLFDLPFLPMPTNFFTEVAKKAIACQRAIVAAQSHKELAQPVLMKVVDTFTNAIHVDKNNRNQNNDLMIYDDFVRNCLLKSGLSHGIVEQIIVQSNSEEIKKKLKDNTDNAIARGAFGTPTMIIHSEGKEPFLVFGSDRFEQIAAVTGKPYYGVALQLKHKL